MDAAASHHHQPNNHPNDNDTADPELSLLEREVLDEYAKLAGNLDNLSTILADLASRPSAQILDALRNLERSTTTVFTLLKASVYSLVLQQEIFGDDDEGGGGGRVRTPGGLGG